MKCLRVTATIITLALCAGCTTTPRRDATETLIARSDFPAAAKAAPDWVRAALRQITALEAELQARPAAR